ncbi:hypothetical protein FFT09_06875 [Saccharomonospora piscinae]|uniref:hypothetical protein n=1 Tax=Saccharomonospora piscinae TaxID=687388 RepID=UPI001105D49C|nr:hypothetical protein [Saccharomonospora piscinae]TLW93144.1 hypothetical protein FFT09_06875 [Saccharomonospora piscinae]
MTRVPTPVGPRRSGPAEQDVAVEIVDPRVDPEPSGWAKFRKRAATAPMWDYSLLRVEAWLSRNPPVLAVVREGGRVLGACLAMLCGPARGQAFAPRPPRRWRPPAPCWAEVYLPWFSGHPAVVFRGHVPEAQQRALLRLFERRLAEHVGVGLLGVVYRALPTGLAGAASGPRRPRREIDPTTVLANRFDSVEDWIAALRPPVRQAVRESRAVAAELDVTAGAGRTDLDAAELAALLNEHRARQDARAWRSGQRARVAGLHLDTRSPVPTAYLDALVRRPEVTTRTYRNGTGTLLGFHTLIDGEGGMAMPHWAALPAGRGGVARLSVDAYARCVGNLVERGRPELTAGRTLLDLKAALGFDTRTLVSVAVPRPVLGR